MLKTMTMMAVAAFLVSGCQAISLAPIPQSAPDSFVVADGIECWYEEHDPTNTFRPLNVRIVTALDWETVSSQRFACPQDEIERLRDAYASGVDITLQNLSWFLNGECVVMAVTLDSLTATSYRPLPDAFARAEVLCAAGVAPHGVVE